MAKLINVDNVKPGMAPAKNVYDRRGRFLIGKNVPLSSKHIRILKAWGVTEVSVEIPEDESPEPSPDIENIYLQPAERYMARKFAKTNLEYEPVAELYRLCVLRKATALKKGIVSEHQMEREFEIPEKASPQGTQKEKLRNMLSDASLNNIDLPSLPTIFYRITNVINNPRSSSKDVADIVSLDTSLSTRLLRIVNSAFYGFASKIDTISRAVVLVGTKQITALALGIQIVNTFKHIPGEFINMESFWKHSVSCGIAARTIARYKNMPNSERMFIGGLLHDIGRLIIYNFKPVHAREVIYLARKDEIFLNDAEKCLLGIRHTEIGRNLLKRWKLPVSIENLAAYHHAPLSAHPPLEPAIICMADIIVNAIETGSSGEKLVHGINPNTWDMIGLSSSMFPVVIRQIDRQLAEIIRFFFND